MMSITHATIALSATSIALGTADTFTLAAAAISSQLPDCDTTESWAGRALYPIAWMIEQRFPHRTITHSFLATGIVAAIASPLWLLGWQYWAAVVIGQFLGWFSDSFTKSGVTAFYPNPARLVIPGNPKARLSTSSPAEYWVLAIAVILLVLNVNLTSAGGISESFARTFFNDAATAAQLFNKHGSQKQITVEVQGLNVQTSQAVAGRFTVIEASDSDVVGESQGDGRLYKIGSAPDVQIQPTSVKATVGDRISITATEQTLQEIAVADWLKRLPQNAYLSGSLFLDEMGELRLAMPIGEFPSLRVFGGQLELSNARPAQVASLLRESWILQGKILVKVRT